MGRNALEMCMLSSTEMSKYGPPIHISPIHSKKATLPFISWFQFFTKFSQCQLQNDLLTQGNTVGTRRLQAHVNEHRWIFFIIFFFFFFLDWTWHHIKWKLMASLIKSWQESRPLTQNCFDFVSSCFVFLSLCLSYLFLGQKFLVRF